MTSLLNFYNARRSLAQAWLSSHIAAAPQDFVHAAANSFVYSFTVTVVLSKGNLVAGLTAGSLAVCAVIIQVVCVVLVKKGNEHFGSERLTPFDKGLCFMVAIVTIGSLGVKPKTSLFFSLLPLLLTMQNADGAKTSLMGIIV